MKTNKQMTTSERWRYTLSLICEKCGYDYFLEPVCAEGDRAWYSSDKDFCPKCDGPVRDKEN